MTIPMYALDDFLVEILKEQEFKEFCTQTVGNSLELVKQLDSSQLTNKSNYVYFANFRAFCDYETNIVIYSSYIDIVVPLKNPVYDGDVLYSPTKKEIEQISIEIVRLIHHNLRTYGVEVDGKRDKTMKLLGSTPAIPETKNSYSSKLVLSLTFGVNNKAKGTCKQ